MQRGIAHERTAGVDVDTRRGILYSSALGNELLILSLSLRLKRERERATGTTMERKIAKKDRAEGGRKEGQQHRRREAYRSVPPSLCVVVSINCIYQRPHAASYLHFGLQQQQFYIVLSISHLPTDFTHCLVSRLACCVDRLRFQKKKRTLHPALFIYSFHPYFSVLSKRALGRTKEACWINSVPYLYKSGGKNKKKRKHVCAAQKWKRIWAIADRTNRKMMESVHKKRLVFSFNHIRSTNVASDVLSRSKMFFFFQELKVYRTRRSLSREYLNQLLPFPLRGIK